MPRALNEDFTGLRHHSRPDGAVEISCRGVLRNLELALAPFPMRAGTPCDTPMGTTTMHHLIVERGDTALLRPDLVAPSQKLLGIISFVVMHVRPDSYFSCNFLAGFANPRNTTKRAFDAIVRVGWYLISTRDLPLVVDRQVHPKTAFFGDMLMPRMGMGSAI